MPRRRCVGRTETAEIADAGRQAFPGTVSSVGHERKVAQIRSSSNAAQLRSRSQIGRTSSATFATSGRSRKAVDTVSI
jgi:hypothetical protein